MIYIIHFDEPYFHARHYVATARREPLKSASSNIVKVGGRA